MLKAIWSLCKWRERMTAKHYLVIMTKIEMKFINFVRVNLAPFNRLLAQRKTDD